MSINADVSKKLKLNPEQYAALINWSHKRINAIVSKELRGDCHETSKALAEEFEASDHLYNQIALIPGEITFPSTIHAIRTALRCLDANIISEDEFANVVRGIFHAVDRPNREP